MKQLDEIEIIVRIYLDNAAAVCERQIIDSINFLSNIFSVDSIDISQSTAVDGTTLTLPTDCIEIDTVFIDGDEVRKLKSLDNLQTVIDNETQRWYEFGGKIQFTSAFTTIETTQIFYKKGFLEPTDEIATDVPERLIELVYIGAQYRYYNLLITRAVTKRGDIPDVKVDDLRKVRDDIKKSYFEKIKMIQMNG